MPCLPPGPRVVATLVGVVVAVVAASAIAFLGSQAQHGRKRQRHKRGTE